MLRQQKRT